MPVRILLCGYYFQGNRGDDLLRESIRKTLSRHGEVRGASTETFDPDLLDWCQLLVLGAGSLITPRGIGGYRHAQVAREKNKKIFYYAQTIEAGHPHFQEHLARADLITVRDSASKKVVEDHGFRAVLTGDPLFEKKRRKIGFSFRRWVNEPARIEEALAALLDELAWDDEVLSLPYTEHSTDTESDTAFHEAIIHKMKNKPRLSAFDDAIGSLDLFIGMRLHALLSAVHRGKNVLAIDYDPKIRRIFADLGMEDRVVSYEEVHTIARRVKDHIFRLDALALREKANEALIARICADIKGEPMPRISVVMPTYNRADYLNEAIDSIRAQTLSDWELVIVDDGSTDTTRSRVESYKDPRIQYHRFGHQGISFSRNIGSLLSRGPIIAVADSDDINLPNRLEVTLKEMEESGADLFYSSMFHLDDTGKKEKIPSRPYSYQRLQAGNFIYHPTVAYRREVALTCPYPENLEMVEDYHLYLQAARKGYRFHRVEEPLILHRLHEEQISSVRSGEMAEIHKKLVDSKGRALQNERDGNHPMVSVIVPTYNRPGRLKEALMSVLSQTYPDVEIIVVNDAGDDVTEVVDSLNHENKIVHLQHHENKGLAASRNTGLKAARGTYVAYLDDDDIYYPNHLETLVGFLEESRSPVAYTDSHQAFETWIPDRYVMTGKRVAYSSDFDRQKLLVHNYIPVLNLIHRRDLLEKTGFFDEGLDTHEDWDLWIRLAQQCDFHHIKAVTAEFRTRLDENRITSSGNRKSFLRTLRIIHARYAPLVADPRLFEQQRQFQESLAAEVEIIHKDSSLIQYERLHQYGFAKEFVKGKKVLDLACGEGEGSFLLSAAAASVTGMDAHDKKIRDASSRHVKENLRFIKGSMASNPIEGEKIFDVIVAFEAFEPGVEPNDFIREVKRLLKDKGIFIVSTSNETAHRDFASGDRPHHKGFYFQEFKELLEGCFRRVRFIGQGIYYSSNLWPIFSDENANRIEYVVEGNPTGFAFVEKDKKIPQYFIAMASNSPQEMDAKTSILVDSSNELLRQHERILNRALATRDALQQALAEREQQAAQATAERERLAREATQLQGELMESHRDRADLAGRLHEKESHLINLERLLRVKEQYVRNLEKSIQAKEAQAADLESAIHAKDTHIVNIESALHAKDAHIGNLQAAIQNIHSSDGWKLLSLYYRIRDRLFPPGSRRRAIMKRALQMLKPPARLRHDR
ncbi:MAG: glycosyltransferase [Nitrospirota bacterium]